VPELPEVETIRAQLDPVLPGLTVIEAGSHPSARFTPAVEALGAELGPIRRRGKFLLVDLVGPYRRSDRDHPAGDRRRAGERELIIHLGMTGSLTVTDGAGPVAETLADPYLRAWWRLEHPAGPAAEVEAEPRLLAFRDVRRFGRIRVVPTGDHQGLPTLHHLGPEPFDPRLDGHRFAELVNRSRRPLKTRLLSQRPIAGVGNIYADEALWLAGINPRITGRLSPTRAASLLDAIRTVLHQAIGNGGTTLRDYRDASGGQGTNQRELQAYGRAGLPCARCGTPLRAAALDTRTTTWCPTCQRR
jgi:formamidopyrimidine-DNA glycosylase